MPKSTICWGSLTLALVQGVQLLRKVYHSLLGKVYHSHAGCVAPSHAKCTALMQGVTLLPVQGVPLSLMQGAPLFCKGVPLLQASAPYASEPGHFLSNYFELFYFTER